MRPGFLGFVVACLAATTALAAPSPSSDAERLRAYLRAVAAGAASVGVSELKLAPARPGMTGSTSPPGAVLAFTGAQLTLDGAPVADQAELLRAMEEARARRQLFGAPPGAALPLLVDIDRATPWPRVVEVTSWLARRPFDVRLRFERPAPVPPFAKSPIDPDIGLIKAERDPAAKARMLARLISRVLAGCQRGLDALGQLGNVGAAERTSVFVAMVERLLDDPSCKVDLPSLQTIVAVTVSGTPLAVVPVRFDPRARPPERVMAGLQATWREVVEAGLVDKLLRPGPPRSTFFVVAPR